MKQERKNQVIKMFEKLKLDMKVQEYEDITEESKEAVRYEIKMTDGFIRMVQRESTETDEEFEVFMNTMGQMVILHQSHWNKVKQRLV